MKGKQKESVAKSVCVSLTDKTLETIEEISAGKENRSMVVRRAVEHLHRDERIRAEKLAQQAHKP
jgi:metal-responsive CopG/Arc/MetJ family transcriptional regulator